MATSLLNAEILSGLGLPRSCANCNSHCEFIYFIVLLFLENAGLCSFLEIIYYFWFLQYFTLIFHNNPWVIEGVHICVILMSCLKLSIPGLQFSASWPVLGVYVICSLLKKKSIWWSLKDVLVCWYNHKSCMLLEEKCHHKPCKALNLVSYSYD